MSVPRGTTPTFTLTFDNDIDLSSAHNVYVTFKSGTRTLTKKTEELDVTAHAIGVYLKQIETLPWRSHQVSIQANWTDANGGRVASDVVNYPIGEQLLEQVVK